ncbi:guanosine-3',5'-bis(diphosphate) 3'-pyrophosphohydrolase [Candidatus Kinetoplastibacterium blastocrithidii TCC012E]|uniref:Guanosine-3',5'-bis(Diphosphate) 3'-pyrophosphohydrolase n=1 Tax=Candidatus Kinetoplastidibacterium blastocrithidiae TCC012E TaxID=1208922 RepID=M1M3I7_9PROT|nr:HD domain-containing protein [Candidatus Kinetoplastibacterium blastocrithidii]AFZ83591.1 guanosine-3',5'-bis(diphosphate) 3'-pyrophosphohydrolase [Candidatus Kinetoplastibacterium blastocrithidii (ex Strigomonas culicis)]AGF49709.1 guanosine-3',5'-bis(diphosphate) 3'-pyrophosphohydrolase [Candidatus Kinetoplastibacterium blastocrithidii TCC012E]
MSSNEIRTISSSLSRFFKFLNFWNKDYFRLDGNLSQFLLIKNNSFLSLLKKLKLYLSKKDLQIVCESFILADKVHAGQKRESGSPYISHPIAVAEICSQWKLDKEAISAALLHDVIEDHGISKLELETKFGKNVAILVDGLSKFDKLDFSNKLEQQAANLRKMLIATDKDIRVILIKLADRLHNMRTINAINNPIKKRRVANETLEIYAPIAYRLGLNITCKELQDLSFAVIYPHRFKIMYKAILFERQKHNKLSNKIRYDIYKETSRNNLDVEVRNGSTDSLFSSYKKMLSRGVTFSEITDTYYFIITTSKISDCYSTMGVIHQYYKPINEKFKDYISMPKINGYQSLHTTVISSNGIKIKFQIRTKNMDNLAENGIANYWIKKQDNTEFQKQLEKYKFPCALDIHNETYKAKEFLEYIKTELLQDTIYVFSSSGKVINLPKDSTVIDFAYAIKINLGNKVATSKINGKWSSLYKKLNSGDRVEIITSNRSNPDIQWLNHIKSIKAIYEVRKYLNSIEYEKDI